MLRLKKYFRTHATGFLRGFCNSLILGRFDKLLKSRKMSTLNATPQNVPPFKQYLGTSTPAPLGRVSAGFPGWHGWRVPAFHGIRRDPGQSGGTYGAAWLCVRLGGFHASAWLARVFFLPPWFIFPGSASYQQGPEQARGPCPVARSIRQGKRGINPPTLYILVYTRIYGIFRGLCNSFIIKELNAIFRQKSVYRL